MNRRNLIRRLATLAFSYTVFRSLDVRGSVSSETPHAEAITVVLSSHQKEIEEGELKYFRDHGVGPWRGELAQYRWHDTFTRSWSVTRPVAPGVVDSTHWFIVAYSINGVLVCSWSVDTRAKKADLQTLKAKPL